MSPRCDLLVPEDREAMLIHVLRRLPVVLVSRLRVLQSLPRLLLSCFVILFVMSFRGTAMSVGSIVIVMQLRG